MVKDILRNLRKDILVEFRSRFAFNISISFAAITTIALSLAAGGIQFTPKIQSILLWLVVFFSLMNGLSHVFTREEDQGTALLLRISLSPDAIYLSKLIYNLLFMTVMVLVIAPLFVFFLQVNVVHAGYFFCCVLSGGISIATATAILAAMVAKAGGKGSLFTIISFPILLPILWIVIAATTKSLDPANTQEYGNLLFLLAFSGFVAVISFLLFRFIWIEE